MKRIVKKQKYVLVQLKLPKRIHAYNDLLFLKIYFML